MQGAATAATTTATFTTATSFATVKASMPPTAATILALATPSQCASSPGLSAPFPMHSYFQRAMQRPSMAHLAPPAVLHQRHFLGQQPPLFFSAYRWSPLRPEASQVATPLYHTGEILHCCQHHPQENSKDLHLLLLTSSMVQLSGSPF